MSPIRMQTLASGLLAFGFLILMRAAISQWIKQASRKRAKPFVETEPYCPRPTSDNFGSQLWTAFGNRYISTAQKISPESGDLPVRFLNGVKNLLNRQQQTPQPALTPAIYQSPATPSVYQPRRGSGQYPGESIDSSSSRRPAIYVPTGSYRNNPFSGSAGAMYGESGRGGGAGRSCGSSAGTAGRRGNRFNEPWRGARFDNVKLSKAKPIFTYAAASWVF